MSLAPPSTQITQTVAATLGVPSSQAAEIVEAFVDHVARPFDEKLSKTHGRDLAARNPFVYAALGTRNVDE